MTLILDIDSLPAVEADKRERLGVALYDAGLVSQGQAASIAGVSRAKFIDALGKYGVTPFQYDEEEILGDVAVIRRVGDIQP